MGVTEFLFHGLCHQIAERSFSAGGYVMPACTRCAGLYVGFALALPWALWRMRDGAAARSRVLTAGAILAGAAFLVDGAANTLALWETANLARYATGVMLGLLLSPYLASLFGLTVSGAAGTTGATGAPAQTRGAGVLAAMVAVAALATAANAPAGDRFLRVEAAAAAAGAFFFVTLVHAAILSLAVGARGRRLAAALALAPFTAAAQMVTLSYLRTMAGI